MCFARIKIILHPLFLSSSTEVIESIVNYILNRDRVSFKVLKNFAYSYFSVQDFSTKLKEENLYTKGKFYNLDEIYEKINGIYFDGKVEAKITWFKVFNYKKLRHITFGSYDHLLKLIRINELLDRDIISLNFIKSKNLISGKSPPNGLSCSVQVSNTVEALIFLASAPFLLNPLPLAFFLVFFFRCFTIWVPPVFGVYWS